jgi:hypothetical protein
MLTECFLHMAIPDFSVPTQANGGEGQQPQSVPQLHPKTLITLF